MYGKANLGQSETTAFRQQFSCFSHICTCATQVHVPHDIDKYFSQVLESHYMSGELNIV